MSKRIWLISDPHFHHANMIAGGRIGNRPQFRTVEDMHDTICGQWNAVVEPQDKVYVLGDITLSRDSNSLAIVRRLQGRKRLILGNHDLHPVQAYLDVAGFEKVLAYRKLGGCVLSHIPVHPSQFVRFKGNIHGHTHDHHVRSGPDGETYREGSQWVKDPRYLNVCVEPLNYTPLLLDEALAMFEARTW